MMLPNQAYEFRWVLNTEHFRRKDYNLFLQVFSFEEGNDVALNLNPSKDHYVELSFKS